MHFSSMNSKADRISPSMALQVVNVSWTREKSWHPSDRYEDQKQKSILQKPVSCLKWCFLSLGNKSPVWVGLGWGKGWRRTAGGESNWSLLWQGPLAHSRTVHSKEFAAHLVLNTGKKAIQVVFKGSYESLGKFLGSLHVFHRFAHSYPLWSSAACFQGHMY